MKFLILILFLSGSYTWAAEKGTQLVQVNENIVSDQFWDAPQKQIQPDTIVEATPLNPSKAELLRRKREQEEKQTEDRIVQELEESRLKDEKERAQRLFGDKLQQSSQQTPQAQQPVWQPVLPQQPTAQPTQPPTEPPTVSSPQIINNNHQVVGVDAAPNDTGKKSELEREVLKNEILERKSVLPTKESTQPVGYYMTGVVGMTDYSRAVNVQSKMGAGFSIGVDMSENLAFEGMFFYSRHLIKEGYWKRSMEVYQEMDQYNFGALVKYKIFSGLISPYISGVGNITQRNYSEIGANSYGQTLRVRDLDKEATSTAFDVGLSVGFEFKIGQNFSAGFDWRYMRNLYQETEFDFGQWRRNNGTPIEELDYHLLSFSGKLTF